MNKPSLHYKSITKAAYDAVQYIDNRRQGLIKSLRTPWSKYNHVSMDGIEWNTIHTIAGMSGSGKTAIINQLETELFNLNPDENFAVLSFNFEMLARQLVSRKLSNKLDLTTRQLHSGIEGFSLNDTEFHKVLGVQQEFNKLPIFYVEMPGTVEMIRNTIEKFIKEDFNKDRGVVVMLDHTILVRGRQGEMERMVLVELMIMANSLKKQHKIAFVFLSQLNREIESADRITEPSQQFPKKKDLFGGDSVFMFSDLVMVSMNPEQLGMETYGPKAWPTCGALFWHFIKVREGQPCIAKMKNELKYNRVVDYKAPDSPTYQLKIKDEV
tara:strand:+ start:7982 stop:8959 length:978 start_codon:yes stop_codon:yes gene_type:complete